MARKRKEPSIADELLDELLSGSDALQAFLQRSSRPGLKKALTERILNAEMDHHLDAEGEQGAGNQRHRELEQHGATGGAQQGSFSAR